MSKQQYYLATFQYMALYGNDYQKNETRRMLSEHGHDERELMQHIVKFVDSDNMSRN